MYDDRARRKPLKFYYEKVLIEKAEFSFSEPSDRAGEQGCSKQQICYSLIDSFLCLFIFGPLITVYWRGTWQLLDHYLFPENREVSMWMSLAGSMPMVFVTYIFQAPLQEWAGDLARNSSIFQRILFVLISRVFIYVAGLTDVNHWRGIWEMLDLYTGETLLSALVSLLTGIIGLWATRSSRTAIVPPFALSLDLNAKQIFEKTTLMKTKLQDGWVFFADVFFSALVVETLSITFWRGAWLLLDLYVFPRDALISAWTTFVSGCSLAVICFCLQWPMALLVSKLKDGVAKLIIEDVYYFLILITGILHWHGVWNLCEDYFLTNYPTMGYAMTHTIGFLLLTVTMTSSNIIMKGVEVDGRSPGGTGCIFSISYIQPLCGMCSTPSSDNRNIVYAADGPTLTSSPIN